MPFTPVTYNTGAAPGLDGPAFNAMQTQYAAAINAFERDLFTPFVFSGLVATKDGTTLSQLDVTAGVAFALQSDGQSELYRIAPTATTFSASGHASSTLYLDLQPDGTWSWGTAHSAQSGYLAIAQVTTDSSSNIATVTDKRTLNTTLLSGMAGTLLLPPISVVGAFNSSGAATSKGGFISQIAGTGANAYAALQASITGTSVVANWQLLLSGANGAFSVYDGTNTKPIAEFMPNPIGQWIFNSNGTIYSPFFGLSGYLATMASAGGGISGYAIWAGTTDPGSAANEGDLWADG